MGDDDLITISARLGEENDASSLWSVTPVASKCEGVLLCPSLGRVLVRSIFCRQTILVAHPSPPSRPLSSFRFPAFLPPPPPPPLPPVPSPPLRIPSVALTRCAWSCRWAGKRSGESCSGYSLTKLPRPRRTFAPSARAKRWVGAGESARPFSVARRALPFYFSTRKVYVFVYSSIRQFVSCTSVLRLYKGLER